MADTTHDIAGMIARAAAIDPVLEVEFDTQLDVQRDPYGAREAIEAALYLIRDLTSVLTSIQADRDAWRARAEEADAKLRDALMFLGEALHDLFAEDNPYLNARGREAIAFHKANGTLPADLAKGVE